MQEVTRPLKPSKVVIFCVILVCIAALLLAVLLVITTLTRESLPKVSLDPEKYYATFLTNGQVYFGHLAKVQSGYLAMSEIYYLQMKQPLQQPTETKEGEEAKEIEEAKPELSLVKLGEELHAPEDSMIINRDQVLFFEPLKDDGQVVKAIKEYKTK